MVSVLATVKLLEYNISMGTKNSRSLRKFQSLSVVFGRLSVWIFISGIILGVAVLLLGEKISNQVITKILGTMLVLVLAAFLSGNLFRMLATGKKLVQMPAVFGLLLNITWVILWTLMIWGVFDIWKECEAGKNCLQTDLSIVGTISYIVSVSSVIILIMANILNISENKSYKFLIRFFKLLSIACLIYEEVFAILFILGNGVIADWLIISAIIVAFVCAISSMIAATFSLQKEKKK